MLYLNDLKACAKLGLDFEKVSADMRVYRIGKAGAPRLLPMGAVRLGYRMEQRNFLLLQIRGIDEETRTAGPRRAGRWYRGRSAGFDTSGTYIYK